MTNYKATPEGIVPLTESEETELASMLSEVSANADAHKGSLIRKERDEKLAATDWRASSDLTLSTEWATYRQALRDIPSQAGFPHTITWPTKPGA